MKKDIFIDNNVAKNFTNPADKEYKEIINWLKEYDESRPNTDNITILVGELQKKGRLNFIKNHQIEEFKNAHFNKSVERRLRSNTNDHDHIPVVLLSDRKIALSIDDNFIYDLIHFHGFN